MTIRKRPPHAAPPRETYRHGDLRRALLDAGIALAREGGPTAVVLREATRQAGVAPNAAYRHFANHQALFDAVRAHALGALAQAIEREWRKALRVREPAAQARALLRAVGTGYLGFAQAETGLFRTAFVFGQHEVQVPPDPARTAAMGLNPFELLGAALDAMVATGVLPAERRPHARHAPVRTKCLPSGAFIFLRSRSTPSSLWKSIFPRGGSRW